MRLGQDTLPGAQCAVRYHGEILYTNRFLVMRLPSIRPCGHDLCTRQERGPIAREPPRIRPERFDGKSGRLHDASLAGTASAHLAGTAPTFAGKQPGYSYKTSVDSGTNSTMEAQYCADSFFFSSL